MFFDKRGNTKIPPPPYKVPNLHPCSYYNTCQLKESEMKTLFKKSVPDAYPWLDLDDPRRI